MTYSGPNIFGAIAGEVINGAKVHLTLFCTCIVKVGHVGCMITFEFIEFTLSVNFLSLHIVLFHFQFLEHQSYHSP